VGKINYIRNPKFGNFEQWVESELGAVERAFATIPATLYGEEVTGTTYTLVSSDQDKVKKTTNGSAVTITIPNHSTVPFEIGTMVYFYQEGAGTVTLEGTSTSVTINSHPTLTSGGQYALFFIWKEADNVWAASGDLIVVADSIIIPDEAGYGIKIDPDAPSWGWRDILGFVLPDQQGANSPTLAAFIGGNVRRFHFSNTDRFDAEFHIPHDHVPGTDLYVHVHWSHNGTAISGNFVIDFYSTYAKRESGVYGTEKNVTLTYNTTNIGTTPQYSHQVQEVQLSTSGGSATLLDTDLIEPDGVIGMSVIVTTIPTITGGSPNEPFVFHVDLHYQSTNIGTKDKDPGYYGT